MTREEWLRYIDGLGRCNETAKELAKKYIETHEVDSPEGRQALIRYCYSLVNKYGEAAAELACMMYDAVAEAEGYLLDPAEPADMPEYAEVAKAVNGTMKNLLRAEIAAAAISRLVKLCGQDTTLNNAIRDGALFAWIPVGDTCPYCLQIAAEGWQKASEDALEYGHAKHIHGNCNCAFQIKHDPKTKYDFYNPDFYQEIFDSAEGSTADERFNAVRRMIYDREKDTIRAQKRAAYAEAKELEAEANEEQRT